MGKVKELEAEFDNLMRAGYDELACGDMTNAEEYFADAGSLLNTIEDEAMKNQLATKYNVNPLDFAR